MGETKILQNCFDSLLNSNFLSVNQITHITEGMVKEANFFTSIFKVSYSGYG